jgi:hypothetical protein
LFLSFNVWLLVSVRRFPFSFGNAKSVNAVKPFKTNENEAVRSFVVRGRKFFGAVFCANGGQRLSRLAQRAADDEWRVFRSMNFSRIKKAPDDFRPGLEAEIFFS